MNVEEKRIIGVVTVTGADDSVELEELVSVVKEYPFVEFGILLSKKQQGTKRFPSRDWLEELYILWRQEKLTLSGHLCGEWLRDLCLGKPSFFEDFGYIWKMFERLQLNFHAEPHTVDDEGFCKVLREYFVSKSTIFQMDGINEEIFYALDGRRGISAFSLFDLSGGAGVLPKEWPEQFINQYYGYAGGLSPANLQEELERISEVTTSSIWIDAETLLRSQDDTVFDLRKVRSFLEIAKPWTILR